MGDSSLRREQIFSRDDYHCVYCGEQFEPEALTIDHVQPRMRGGDRSGGNLVTACGACNARKGGLRLADFLRVEPNAQRIFFERAAAHIWPRILRTLEVELARPARTRRDR
jgi:5-methylcytosine-specific restriction endonuclease McrA